MRKILVVEDDMLIAMELAARLGDLGHAVLGPAHSVAEAEALIAGGRPDAALLDANLAGQSSVPLALTLTRTGVPVAFCTGYDQLKNAPPELASAPVLTKPVNDAEFAAAIAKLLA